MSWISHISSVIENVKANRGKEPDLSDLLRFGIGPVFDSAVMGVDMKEGGVVGIQGIEKTRKTTLAANIILHMAIQLYNRGGGESICVDMLESGLTPEAYVDILVAIASTRFMISSVFNPNANELDALWYRNWPGAYNHKTQKEEGTVFDILKHERLEKQLCISHNFLKWGKRTELQQLNIERAEGVLSNFPIHIFGSHRAKGDTRNISNTIKRWEKLVDNGCRVFVVDHLQQYTGYGGHDYTRMENVVDILSNFVSSHQAVLIAISQVSVTSARLARQGDGVMEAKGGNKLASEAGIVLQPHYDSEKHPTILNVSTPRARWATAPKIKQDIEPFSGSFLGWPSPAYR